MGRSGNALGTESDGDYGEISYDGSGGAGGGGDGDSASKSGELSVEGTLWALVLAFKLATAVKLALFAVRCHHPWHGQVATAVAALAKYWRRGAAAGTAATSESSAALECESPLLEGADALVDEASSADLSDIARCFLYGPELG